MPKKSAPSGRRNCRSWQSNGRRSGNVGTLARIVPPSSLQQTIVRNLTNCRLGYLALTLLLCPYPAHAEVMDKEPALASIWILCGIGTLLALLLAIKRTTWLGIVAVSGIMAF